jgi:uncharacterized RDD family membrane protein YckC
MPKLIITTPEQVSFRYDVAGLLSRALAWFTDYLLIFAGYAVIVLLFAALGTVWAVMLIILGIFVLDMSYFAFFEIYYAGQTPGKRLFNLRVISLTGTRIRFADAMIRNLLRPVDMLPWGMVLGGMVAFLDGKHRRLGDMAAETVVIREVRRTLPQTLATQKARVNSFQSNRAVQQRIMTRMTRVERDLVLDLAVRRDQLDAATREELFAQAAEYFRTRLSLPEDLIHLSDEQTVINIALIVQDAKFTG